MPPQLVFGTALFGIDQTELQSLFQALQQAGIRGFDSSSQCLPFKRSRAEDPIGKANEQVHSYLIDTAVFADTRNDGSGDLTRDAIEDSVNALHMHEPDPSTTPDDQVENFNEQVQKEPDWDLEQRLAVSVMPDIASNSLSALLRSRTYKWACPHRICMDNVLARWQLILTTVLFRKVYASFVDALAAIPGPKLWAVSRIPYVFHLLTGQLVHRISALHQKYGPVVRIAPNEVSFATADAWRTIYGSSGHDGAFPKNPVWHPATSGHTNSISTANAEDHARIRRVLAKGFDGDAFRRQRPVLDAAVDRFVERLQARVLEKPDGPVNMTQWLNFCTFDVVAMLGFSEDIFECVRHAALPPTILDLFESSKQISRRIALQLLPALQYVRRLELAYFGAPAPNRHFSHVQKYIDKRLKAPKQPSQDGHPADFLGALKRGLDEEHITEPEMVKTAHVLFGGGGGTTAAALAGTINYLLRYPEKLKRLQEEVRAAFRSSADMTPSALERTEYLHSVIQEGLRLCPPMPCGVPRMAPRSGAFVSGYWLPGGNQTNVYVQHFSAHRNPDSWAAPNDFAPERWTSAARDVASPYHSDNRSAMHAFSLGPRRCIGEKLAYAEMHLILARLVFHFDMEVASSSKGSSLPQWEDQRTWPLWERLPFYVKLIPASHHENDT
ncbi:MAG: hypothetical protein Q9162_005124 [Coniocarpon cinnabarinum]